MLKLKKNKKAQEEVKAGGFGFIIVVIIAFLTVGVIVAVIKNVASRADEQVQVDACRITNAFKYGLKEKTGGAMKIEQACTTIDKTKKKLQVPTKDYPQTKEGVELEMREMIKNCWYMWLEGSQYNMFERRPFTQDCFTCYTFKVEDDVEGTTFSSLENSMNEPFFATDSSDKCTDAGGFFNKPSWEENMWKETKSEIAAEQGEKCFVRKEGTINECENRGGFCSPKEGVEKPEEYTNIYDEWSCPKRNQLCYIKEDNEYSYLRYIREYGPRGGEIMFVSPEEGNKDVTDVAYEPGKIYAISFVSPSKQFCATAEEGKDAKCYAAIGGYVVGAIALAVGAGFAIAGVGAGAAATFLLGLSGKGAAAWLGWGIADAAVEGVTGSSIIDLVKTKGLDTVAGPISVEVPNFIVVSTLEHAQELGCTIDYGG